MKTFKLNIIRHGMTDGNIEGRYVGITDLPLCKQGKEQIEEYVEKYEYPKAQKVYTSPLKRAVQTAELIYPDIFLEKVDYLKECDFGIFENRKMDELYIDIKFRTWMESGMKAAPEGGESLEAFKHRLDLGICKIFKDMMDNDITAAAMVAHGGVIRSLLSRYGLPKLKEHEWEVDFGKGYTIMTYTQLWMRDGLFEIYDPLPYNDSKAEPSDCNILDA